MERIAEFLEGLALPVFLAVAGGIAKSSRQHEQKNWREFVSDIIVSAFAGIVVHLVLQDHGLPGSQEAALIAIAGYSGPVVLDALSRAEIKLIEKVLGEKVVRPGRRRGSDKQD